MSYPLGKIGEFVQSFLFSPKKTISNNNNTDSSKKRKNSSDDIRLVYDSPSTTTSSSTQKQNSSKRHKASPPISSSTPSFIQLASKPFVSLINVLSPKPSFRKSIRDKRRKPRRSSSPIMMQDLSKPTEESNPKKEYEPTPYVTRIPWSMSPLKTTHPDTTFVSSFSRLDLLEEEDKFKDSKTMDRYLSQEVIKISRNSRSNPPSPRNVEPVTPSPKKLSKSDDHDLVLESERHRLMEERSQLTDRWKKIMSDRSKKAFVDLTEDDDVINSQYYEKIKNPITHFKYSREQQERLERENHIKSELAKLRKSGAVSTVKLSKEEEELVREAFEGGDDSDVLSEGFNLKISRADILCLQDGEWLGDEAVNFYLNVVMDHCKKSVHVFNTFFLGMLGESYDKVKRWTRKVDIFSKEKVIVPVHLGNHWCCAVINFKDKRFEYYDSLGGQNYECLELLREYVVKEYKDKKKGNYDLDDWEDYMPNNIPKQMNGYDCGVFMCRFAYCSALNMPFKFSQKEMQYLRKRMVLDILSKTLTV